MLYYMNNYCIFVKYTFHITKTASKSARLRTEGVGGGEVGVLVILINFSPLFVTLNNLLNMSCLG